MKYTQGSCVRKVCNVAGMIGSLSSRPTQSNMYRIARIWLNAAGAMAGKCKGTTRAGKPCSITKGSALTNDSGRLAAEPLRRGGEFCLFHAKPFCTKPVEPDGRACVLVMLDLETTGVDNLVKLLKSVSAPFAVYAPAAHAEIGKLAV